jgi:hypothetical protein
MKKIEEDILGWFNLTEYLWFSFGERYRILVLDCLNGGYVGFIEDTHVESIVYQNDATLTVKLDSHEISGITEFGRYPQISALDERSSKFLIKSLDHLGRRRATIKYASPDNNPKNNHDKSKRFKLIYDYNYKVLIQDGKKLLQEVEISLDPYFEYYLHTNVGFNEVASTCLEEDFSHMICWFEEQYKANQFSRPLRTKEAVNQKN